KIIRLRASESYLRCVTQLLQSTRSVATRQESLSAARPKARLAFLELFLGCLLFVHSLKPVVDFLTNFILGVPVALLKISLKLIPTTIDGCDVILGKLAPLFLYLSRQLLPVALNAIPIH